MNDLDPTQWRKSSYSDHQGGSCVEVASLTATIAIRDSKNPNRAELAFGRKTFRTLLREIRSGRHDLG